MFTVERFFCPDGIVPDTGLTGANNTHTHIHTHAYIYTYIYIYIYIYIHMYIYTGHRPSG